MFFKEQKWESKKYRDAAKGESCKLGLVGCLNETESVVLCHCPGWINKILLEPPIGASKKADDFNAVDACYRCHDQLDGRTNKTGGKNIVEAFVHGRYKTLVNRIQRGIIK